MPSFNNKEKLLSIMLFGREDLDEASEEEDLPRTSKRKLLDHCIPDEEYRKDIKDNDDN